MTQTPLPRTPGPRRSKRAPGLGVRGSLLVAGILGTAVVGSAWLKSRHIDALAHRVEWQTPGFLLQRPGFDRAAFEAAPERGSPAGGKDAAPDPDPRARQDFLSAMEAFQLQDDRRALRGLQQALERAPGWPPPRFYRGACELLGGHPLAATADLQAARAAGFDPPDGPCDWWLGVAHFYNGDQGAGRRCMELVAASQAPQAEQARSIVARLDAMER